MKVYLGKKKKTLLNMFQVGASLLYTSACATFVDVLSC